MVMLVFENDEIDQTYYTQVFEEAKRVVGRPAAFGEAVSEDDELLLLEGTGRPDIGSTPFLRRTNTPDAAVFLADGRVVPGASNRRILIQDSGNFVWSDHSILTYETTPFFNSRRFL